MDTGELRDKISNMPTNKELYAKFIEDLCDIQRALNNYRGIKAREVISWYIEAYNNLKYIQTRDIIEKITQGANLSAEFLNSSI